LLNLLYFDLVSLKEAASKMDRTEQDILLGLRMEFNLLRNQNRGKTLVES